MSKPISEFIHIEHIGRETLSANPYDEIWIRRIQIEEDKAYLRMVRQVPAVTEAYIRRTGKPVKSLDDIMNALG